MSDYTPIEDFSAKDALATGNPDKIILGADIDAELSAIATAIATKYDSSDLATQGQAEAGSDNTVLMTPLRVQNWGDANAGMVGDIQALADPNADRILFWDDSAGAVAGLAVGDGITLSGTTLSSLAFDQTAYVTSDQTINNQGTAVDVTDLVFSNLAAGTYTLEAMLRFVSQTVGIRASVNSTLFTETDDYFLYWGESATTLTADIGSQMIIGTTGVNGEVTLLRGAFTIPAQQDIKIRFWQSSSDPSATTIKKNSWFRLQKLA